MDEAALYRIAGALVRAKGVPREDAIGDGILAAVSAPGFDAARGSFAAFAFCRMRAAVTKWWWAPASEAAPGTHGA
jgi:hypothetical protein